MRPPPCISLFWLITAASLAASAVAKDATSAASPEPPEGYVALFDGKTLDGWFWEPEEPQRIWHADGEEGTLGRELRGGYIWTEAAYGDFDLLLDFKLTPGCNSGVFFRADPENPVQGGFEIQVLDSRKETLGKHDMGALYDASAATSNSLRKVREWNSLRLRVEGERVQVWVNGEQVNDVDLSLWTTANQNPDGTPNKFDTALSEMAKTGHIGFQDHGHNVWYRNIFLKEL